MKAHFRTKPAALTLSLAISQLFAAPAVMAADAAPAATGIEEVVVTAQKRKENLQEVPISIQALGAKDLEKHNIVALGDIGAEVPGLNMAPYPGSTEAFFPTFRGITTNALFISAPNPIAVHVDGVFLSQLVGLNNPAADLERIEVLKGPQGVLSGRNATGGAINVYTARPELGQFGFKQQFTVASRGQFLSKTVVNLPIKDDLAMKISYLHNQKDDDGITNSAPGGVQFGKLNSDAYRIDVRWKPTSAVTVDYGYDNSDSKGYDTPPQCLYSYYGAGCTTSRQDRLYVPGNLTKNTNKVEGHTLNINWDATPTLTVRSITGVRKIDTSNHYNYGAYSAADYRADSNPLTVNLTGGGTLQLGHPIDIYNDSWSQEFQFLGEVSKNLKYTAGAYYSSEDGHQSSGPNVGMLVPNQGGPGVAGLLVDNKGLTSAKNTSWAAFGQMTWTPDILEQKLDVVPGVRVTHDHRSVVGYNTGFQTFYGVIPVNSSTVAEAYSVPQAGYGFTNVTGDRSWSKVTPALSLNYHWQKDLMTYFKYSTAYTAGGFDPVAGRASSNTAKFANGFEPETIKSFELGTKGEFFERRLRTNVAVFQTKFNNEQKSTNSIGGGWQTVNVGSSTYQGLEFDLTAAVTDNLRLGFNFAALNHKYNQWIDPTTGTDVTDLRKLYVPKNDYALNIDYRFPNMGLPGKLDGNLNLTHRDRAGTPLNLAIPNVEVESMTPAFSVWNGRLALSQIKAGPRDEGRVTVAVWAKNLTDKKYLIMANQAWVSASGNWGEPRTVGLDVTYKY